MDRPIVYYGALARALDNLKLGQQAMTAVGKLAEAVFGTGTVVDGFTCVPTSPASLAVSLTAGQVYQAANLEASAISLLTQDTHSIVKQAIMLDALSLTLVTPTTPGYAQNVLIEVQYSDSDSDVLLLNYFNAASPSVPLSGPGGNGIAQATTRKGIVSVQTKYGTAATSGTQVSPTPDAGWAPLFVVNLSYGQTSVTAGNISQHASAPFIATKLTGITTQKLTGAATYYVNSSTGSDSNDGKTTSTAFATLQKAANTVVLFNLNGYGITISVANGTYSRVDLAPINGSGTVSFVGNSGTPGSCSIVSTVGSAVRAGSVGSGYSFNGFAVSASAVNASTADPGCGFLASGQSSLTIANISFGATAGPHIEAANGAQVVLGSGTFTLTGSPGHNTYAPSGAHLYAAGAGSSIGSAGFSDGSGRPSLVYNVAISTDYFIIASVLAQTTVLYGSISGSGSFSTPGGGGRYLVNLNAIMNTSGGGASVYPGTAAGVVNTGGQYV